MRAFTGSCSRGAVIAQIVSQYAVGFITGGGVARGASSAFF